MKQAVNDPLFHQQVVDVANLVQNGEVKDVYLKNLDYLEMGFANSIDLAEQAERENIQVGALIKVVVNWPLAKTYQERFWVEVTKVTLDLALNKSYWGRVYSNTQVANYGDLIGPIKPRNVAAIEPSYFTVIAEAA